MKYVFVMFDIFIYNPMQPNKPQPTPISQKKKNKAYIWVDPNLLEEQQKLLKLMMNDDEVNPTENMWQEPKEPQQSAMEE